MTDGTPRFVRGWRRWPELPALALGLAVATAGSPVCAQPGAEPSHFADSTRKLYQLVGEWDVTRDALTSNRTGTRVGLQEGDWAFSFEHRGKLYFFFLDVIPTPEIRQSTPNCEGSVCGCWSDEDLICLGNDLIAWTESTDPEQLTLEFHVVDGHYKPLIAPDLVAAAPGFPLSAVSIDGEMFSQYYSPAVAGSDLEDIRGHMIRSNDDGRTWEKLCELSDERFNNVKMKLVDRDLVPALPAPSGVLLWGNSADFGEPPRREDYELPHTRPPRADLYLGFLPRQSFELTHPEDPCRSMLYFAGLDASGGPIWRSGSEAQAVNLLDTSIDLIADPENPKVTEYGYVSSFSWIPELELWVALNSTVKYYDPSHEIPARVTLLSAPSPWGPWKKSAEPVLDLDRDRAFGTFAHQSWRGQSHGVDSFHRGSWGFAFGHLGTRHQWAGPYSPHILERFTRCDGRGSRCRLTFTLSPDSPYSAVLMQTDIGDPGRWRQQQASAQTESTIGFGSGWRSSGSFFDTVNASGKTYLRTHGADQATALGLLRYTFVPDAQDRWLSFTVCGAGGAVMLIEDDGSGADPWLPPIGQTLTAFRDQLKRGVHGRVLDAIVADSRAGYLGAQPYCGDGGATYEVPVRWYLDRLAGRKLHLFIVDDTREGRIGVSEIARRRLDFEPPSIEIETVAKQFAGARLRVAANVAGGDGVIDHLKVVLWPPSPLPPGGQSEFVVPEVRPNEYELVGEEPVLVPMTILYSVEAYDGSGLLVDSTELQVLEVSNGFPVELTEFLLGG